MTCMITARVDTEKRSRAEKVFNEVGLTTSAAVNLFICAVAMSGGIPFPIGIHQNAARNESSAAHPFPLKLGIAEGRYDFAENFDDAFDAMDDEVSEMFA